MKPGEIKRLAQHLKVRGRAGQIQASRFPPVAACSRMPGQTQTLLATFSFVKMKNYFITNSNSRDAHLLTSFACNPPFLLCTYKIRESNGTVNKTDGRIRYSNHPIFQLALLGAGSQTKNKLQLRLYQLRHKNSKVMSPKEGACSHQVPLSLSQARTVPRTGTRGRQNPKSTGM